MADTFYESAARLLAWVEQEVSTNKHKGVPVSNFAFPRLPQYVSEELLQSTYVILTDRIPYPPVADLATYGAESMPAEPFTVNPLGGLVYIRQDCADREEVFLRALVYESMIRFIGLKRLTLAYLFSFSMEGAAGNPWDELASSLMRRFSSGTDKFNLEEEVKKAHHTILSMIDNQYEIVKQMAAPRLLPDTLIQDGLS